MMTVTTKATGTSLDLDNMEALTDYVRQQIRVTKAFPEEYEESAGVCLVITVPAFMELYDADKNTVEILMDIKDPKEELSEILHEHPEMCQPFIDSVTEYLAGKDRILEENRGMPADLVDQKTYDFFEECLRKHFPEART